MMTTRLQSAHPSINENEIQSQSQLSRSKLSSSTSQRAPLGNVTKNAQPLTTNIGGKAGAPGVAPRRALGDITNANPNQPIISAFVQPSKPASTTAASSKPKQVKKTTSTSSAPKQTLKSAPVVVVSTLGKFDELDDDLPLEVNKGSGLMLEYSDPELEAASALIKKNAAQNAAELFSMKRPHSPIMWQSSSSDGTGQDALLAAQMEMGPFEGLEQIDGFDGMTF